VRGALAEVTAERVTILAERALAVEELTGDQTDTEILQLQTQRDATRDEATRARFDISIARLEEFKAGLGL
jgi:F0F1-type ATP synthase epsilon subunit